LDIAFFALLCMHAAAEINMTLEQKDKNTHPNLIAEAQALKLPTAPIRSGRFEAHARTEPNADFTFWGWCRP
jgi:hypothetical protein